MKTSSNHGSVIVEFGFALALMIPIIAFTVEIGATYRRKLVLVAAAHLGASTAAANRTALPCEAPSNASCEHPRYDSAGALISAGTVTSLACLAENTAIAFLNLKENRLQVPPSSFEVTSQIKRAPQVSGYAPRVIEVVVSKKAGANSCVLCLGELFLKNAASGQSVFGIDKSCNV